MKYYYLLVIIFTLITGCKNPPSKNIQFDEENQRIINTFFDKIFASKYKQAIDELLLSNPNIDYNDSNTIRLRNEFGNINLYSGELISFRLLNKRFVKNDIAAYSILANYQKKFYRFFFIFYKVKNSTRIYKFSYDDAIDEELEESLKLYE